MHQANGRLPHVSGTVKLDPMADMTKQILLTSWHLLTATIMDVLEYVLIFSYTAHQVLQVTRHRPAHTADLQVSTKQQQTASMGPSQFAGELSNLHLCYDQGNFTMTGFQTAF